MEVFLLQILHLYLAKQKLCLRQEGVGTSRRHRERNLLCVQEAINTSRFRRWL